ncbi:4170_t:CDS:2 [Paraglomus brasilianum]|uniref:4170_t:CDS:1 n=1 Tax=Paraglomus brasilianum TaxID=144538 RepID=A0A9N9B776_9GLOM|nr:4170_t:CDS:2 [Paraglomus brasilianum]
MNSIIAVDVIPDNNGKVAMYGAPNRDVTHKLTGKVRIVLSKTLKAKSVVIKLKGRSDYSDWENQYSSVDVLRMEKVLTEKAVLPRGVSDLDFEFNIPGHIPQTYVTNFGMIKYTLVAIVQPTSLLAKVGRAEKSIHFGRYYLTCSRDLLPAPPTKVYQGQRKSILKYELDVPTVVGANEKSMLVRVRLLPLREEGMLKKITFSLTQSEKYSVRPTEEDIQEYAIEGARLIGNVQLSGSSGTKRKRSHPIKPTSLTVSHLEDCWNNPLTYNLPFERYNSARIVGGVTRKTRLKPTITSPLVCVRHKLKIIMSFEDGRERDLELGFPLIVTDIPSDNVGTESIDGNLPTYDDVIKSIESVLAPNEVEAISRPITPVEGDDASYSSSPSRAGSRNNSRPATPNPDEGDYPHTPAQSNNDQPFTSEPLPLPPSTTTLRPKKSTRRIAQTIGRWLHRSDSSNSTSSTGSNTTNVQIQPRLEITPTLSPSYPPNSIGRMYNRTGRPSWYLNMPDEDDIPTITPEIHSAPSSPHEQPNNMIGFDGILGNSLCPPPRHHRTSRNTHRRSASFDPSINGSVGMASGKIVWEIVVALLAPLLEYGRMSRV